MRFLVDMPLSPGLAAWLVRKGHDAIHACEAGLSSSPDAEILNRARDEHRVLITADLDYPRLLALAGYGAPGLILFRGGNFSEPDSLAYLERVLSLVPETDLATCIIVVEKERIRRRRLPVEPGV